MTIDAVFRQKIVKIIWEFISVKFVVQLKKIISIHVSEFELIHSLKNRFSMSDLKRLKKSTFTAFFCSNSILLH